MKSILDSYEYDNTNANESSILVSGCIDPSLLTCMVPSAEKETSSWLLLIQKRFVISPWWADLVNIRERRESQTYYYDL